ncbi:hypothetical protein KPH14_011962 [Odynerus spinipes]|uniref:RNA helicase n=1 Tax=Odynerus spinipes TaxID=1348599 RepID=A0AAD9RCN9_9HYME|nr:hypothetical protein KPH14_011962 [Odynerus spinipes]
MLFRFCNLCHRDINVWIVNLRKYGKRVTATRLKKRGVKNETQIIDKTKTPIIACKRPILNFYKGQTYSKFETIPLASKGWLHSKAKGDSFIIYPEMEQQYDQTIPEPNFENYSLHSSLYDRLEDLGYSKPLQIQEQAIPKILNGQNTVLAAETGCGKTLAYLLPLINQILDWKPLCERRFNSPLGLIVTPTRELAVQIGIEAKRLANAVGISTKIITGGRTKRMVSSLPMDDVDLVVASFGVISKLTTMKVYKLDKVKHIVLDEADALFHETFEDKVKVFMHRLPVRIDLILLGNFMEEVLNNFFIAIQIGYQQVLDERGMPKNTQLTLVSATMPQRISQVLGDIVDVNSLIEVVSEKLHHILVPQKFMRLGPSQKPAELLKYVKPKIKSKEQVIIFSNENATCDWISMFLHECNIDNIHLNGALPLSIRQGKYAAFKSRKINVLSTTNIGSRGLDTFMVRHILNYDFPLNSADYIHRCGRIGRVGSPKDCRVTNFISHSLEIQLVQKIERAIRRGRSIPIINMMKQGSEQESEPNPAEFFDETSQHIIEDINEENSIPY